MLAARRLRTLRNEVGLTQEEAAAIAGESRKQVQKRETNRVHLGALRLLIILERAAGVKAAKK